MTARPTYPFGSDSTKCPDARKHAALPTGLLDRAVWMERKAKTHQQEKCPTCGLWVMWKPKKKKLKQ